MMSPFAPACLPAAPSTPDAVPARGNAARGAKTLLALALLMPLAACAGQPGASVAAPVASPVASPVAAPVATPAATQPAEAPAAAQAQPATADAPRQQQAAPARASQPAAAAQGANTTSARPAAGGTGTSVGTPSGIPVAERATTVGEVPTTPGTADPAPDAASLPGAPAAIPGTPARPAAQAPIQVGQAAAAPSAGTLVQTILALLLVLGLLVALAWAMKRYGPRVSGNSANLRMVGALNIGGRERILVVEVGDQWIVVGAAPGRVNALATMPKGEGTAAGATLAGHTPSAATFADWLKQTIDKRNAK